MKYPLLLLGACLFNLYSSAQRIRVEGPQPNIPSSDENEGEFHVPTAEEMPVFPGCDTITDVVRREGCFKGNICKHLQAKTVYPMILQEIHMEGNVFVGITITETGAISEVELLRGVHPLMDQEAVKAVKTLPDMIPGNREGKPVAMSFVVPFRFRMDD